MATEYTEEQLNYYRICFITTDVIAEGLRVVFKREWDRRYKATFGEWKDIPKNGVDFYDGESSLNQTRNESLLATMVNGKRAEWDCTMLFYALLFSDNIYGLQRSVRKNVTALKKFRNDEFAHMPRGHLSESEFKNAIAKVDTAFQGLGLSTLQIQAIRNQTSFPTEGLRKVLNEVDDLKQELQDKKEKLIEKATDLQKKEVELQEKKEKLHAKEEELQVKEEQRQMLEVQLQKEVAPFCILPPKPSHDVEGRDREVAEITKQLKELKGAKKNSQLSYLYISGNPGSGKSQLAGLVAKQFFEQMKEDPCSTAFVMTLNAESLDTLLESYVAFARLLKCPEYAVTDTCNSKGLKQEAKIANLKMLVSSKVELYASWLLVVDNVTSIQRLHAYLPVYGNEQWARGQLLITTQDTRCIPSTCSFINHISVSKGMKPRDACSLLAMLSGIADSERENEVAQELDYQPLALASAATYVKQVRQSKASSNFSWSDYLDKLKNGKRSHTEILFSELNPSYPKSMTAAITLAVESVMTSDKVMHHTFNFLSLCAHQPLRLDIVINYIKNVEQEIEDEDLLRVRIQRCSLLLLEEEKDSVVNIRLHQVVYDVIKTAGYPDSQRQEFVHGAIRSFNQFIDDNLSEDLDDYRNSLVSSRHLVPHIKILIVDIENMFYSRANISQMVKIQAIALNIKCYSNYFLKFSKVCHSHCEFFAAKKYCNLVLELLQHGNVFDDANAATANALMGHVHQDLGDLRQAKEYHERALAIDEKKFGPQHEVVATDYNNLANVHLGLSELEKAKEFHERALAIRLRKLEPQHVDVATTYNNLALVLRRERDFKQARTYLENALSIRQKKLGSCHVDVAASYNNLGLVLGDLGELEQARECHELALAIRLEKLGAQHVDVAASYQNLSQVLKDQNEHALANRFRSFARAIYQKFRSDYGISLLLGYNAGITTIRGQDRL